MDIIESWRPINDNSGVSMMMYHNCTRGWPHHSFEWKTCVITWSPVLSCLIHWSGVHILVLGIATPNYKRYRLLTALNIGIQMKHSAIWRWYFILLTSCLTYKRHAQLLLQTYVDDIYLRVSTTIKRYDAYTLAYIDTWNTYKVVKYKMEKKENAAFPRW